MKTCTKCRERPRQNNHPYCKVCHTRHNFAVTPGGFKCATDDLPAFVMAAAIHQFINRYARGKIHV